MGIRRAAWGKMNEKTVRDCIIVRLTYVLSIWLAIYRGIHIIKVSLNSSGKN
jgi:hypothetical protein